MSAPTAAAAPVDQVRLAVAAGAERRDIVLRGDVVLGDALRFAMLPVDAPGVAVLDSEGRRVDLDQPAEVLADGTLVHVVGRPPVARRVGALADDAAGRRPPAFAALLAAAAAAALVLTVLAVTGGPVPFAVRLAGVIACAGGALVLTVLPPRVGARAATLVAPVLAFAAAAVLVAPDDAPTRRAALVAGLLAAAVVAGGRQVVTRAARHGDDEAAVVLAVLAALAGTQLVALLVGVPAAAGAAVLLGALPLVLRSLPRLVLPVPDDELIDVAHVSRTAPSVRAPAAGPMRRVDGGRVRGDVGRAERRKDAAVVAVSLLAAALAPVVLVAVTPGTPAGWGATATAVAVAVAFALVPRAARGAVGRWAPRLAAVVVAVAVAAVLPDDGLLRVALATAALALVALVLALVVPLVRGWRSVPASRAADAVESLVVVLALPAGVVAAGLVQLLRQVAS